MLNPVLSNPWVRALGALALLALLALLAHLLSAVLVPLFFAFIVAYIFDPAIDRFEAWKIARMSAIIGLIAVILLLAAGLPFLLIPSVIIEAEALMKAPAAGDAPAGGLAIFDRALARLPEPINSREEMRRFLGGYIRGNAQAFLTQHAQQIASLGKTAGAATAGLFKSVAGAILGVVLLVGNFALFAFVAVYLLKDYDAIIAGINELVPPRHRLQAARIMGQVDLQLKAFLRGQFIVCVCLGTMYAIGLKLSGVPFALLLGCFGALAGFVPYLGLALTIGPAILLVLLAHGIDGHLAGVLATFAIAQALEGNVLTPKIVGSQVGLGPVWIILSIMVFSSALGFVGLLLAVPMAAVLKVFAAEAVPYYKNSTFFGGAAEADAPED